MTKIEIQLKLVGSKMERCQTEIDSLLNVITRRCESPETLLFNVEFLAYDVNELVKLRKELGELTNTREMLEYFLKD